MNGLAMLDINILPHSNFMQLQLSTSKISAGVNFHGDIIHVTIQTHIYTSTPKPCRDLGKINRDKPWEEILNFKN